MGRFGSLGWIGLVSIGRVGSGKCRGCFVFGLVFTPKSCKNRLGCDILSTRNSDAINANRRRGPKPLKTGQALSLIWRLMTKA